jgi:hypothetical protein
LGWHVPVDNLMCVFTWRGTFWWRLVTEKSQ